jgi:hypothetical protein
MNPLLCLFGLLLCGIALRIFEGAFSLPLHAKSHAKQQDAKEYKLIASYAAFRFGTFVPGGHVMSIKASMGPAYTLIGIAIALAVVGVVAALSILPAGVSAGLASASLQIAGFLVLIGLGIAVGILERTFGGGRR